MPVATPSFAALTEARPRHAGIAFRCAACSEPRFARVAIRSFGPDQIVLSSNLVEIERTKERFQFSYVPQEVAEPLGEALDCYTADLFTAFAVMCRRAVQASLLDSKPGEKPHLFDLFKDVADISEIGPEPSRRIETLLFEPEAPEPEIGPEEAALLIEIVKDMFYQRYVRTAKLKAAMKMRRFFAGETTQKITPIGSRRANHSA